MNRLELKQIISEAIQEIINESFVSGFKVTSLSDFLKGEIKEADMLGAKTSTLSPDEMQAYLARTKAGEKTKQDKYEMPFIHGSNIEIKDEQNRTFDLDKLRNAITTRPKKLLKQNAKVAHSGGGNVVYYNIGLPALRGLAVNEKTGEFVVVDTCPGAGACKVYCYAKSGGYIQWKASSMSQTQVLNFLLNDPVGFKNMMESELRAASKKGDKVVVRWHDAGDFFSPEYLDLAYSIAKDFPDIDFYAYTKMAGVALSNKPDNFRTNFSQGATADQEKQVDLKKTKHSVVVPKQMFQNYIKLAANGRPEKDPETGKIQFNSPEDFEKFKKALAAKHGLDVKSIITYDELMKTPVSKDGKKWNVIVAPGDGDDSANRPDVLGTYLLIH